MCYLIWSETKKLEKNFEEIDKEWNVLDQRIETYKVKIQEIDSINGELSKEIAKFDEYR
jgi:prefoldin subunit 5